MDTRDRIRVVMERKANPDEWEWSTERHGYLWLVHIRFIARLGHYELYTSLPKTGAHAVPSFTDLGSAIGFAGWLVEIAERAIVNEIRGDELELEFTRLEDSAWLVDRESDEPVASFGDWLSEGTPDDGVYRFEVNTTLRTEFYAVRDTRWDENDNEIPQKFAGPFDDHDQASVALAKMIEEAE